MTGLSRVFDAAVPPATAPAGCAGVLGYIGREGKTPHVWTPAEWARFAHLVQFPCWVPNLGNHSGAEANDIIDALHLAFGFVPGPAHLLAVVIDYETAGAAEAKWHAALADALGHRSLDAVAYGSLSDVIQIEAAHVWSALWDDQPALEGGMTVHAHQYLSTPSIDYSVVDAWLMARGLRR